MNAYHFHVVQLMEQPTEQPCYCDVKVCGKKKKITPYANIFIIKICHGNYSNI